MRTLLLEDGVGYAQLPNAKPELVIQDMVRKGALDVCLEWCRQHQKLPLFVQTMQKVCGSALTIERLRKCVDLAPDLLGVLLPEIARLGPAGDGELLRIAKTASIAIGLREEALAALGRRTPASAWLAVLRHLLKDDHVVLREQAARQLLHVGDDGDRQEVLRAFLQGRFREPFSVRVEHRDLPLLEGAVGTAQGPARLRLVRLLEGLEVPRKVEFLIGLWKSEDGELRAKCRDALRGVEPNRVLPFIEKELDEGNPSILDVLGAMASVPRALVTRFKAGDATWERFLERMAGEGILHAPGLSDVFVRSLGSKEVGPNAVSLFVRLGDWSDAAKIQKLVAALEPALTGRHREKTLAHILEATGQLHATVRTRVLISVGHPTDRAIVSALADAVLQNTAVRELLPEGMTAAVDREMTSALDGEPERVRRILSYRAARAKTDVQREALTDVLERSMGHASARVRMHAHRLLRTHAERPRYLAATRPLLRDGDAATVRSAIRVLAFGGDVDSIAEIADLLSHSQAIVRNAARDGLIHLGVEAVPLLTKAMSRARPDRRDAYVGVLERIRNGLGADELDELDEDDGQEADRL